jgi:hypothetical protein
MLWSRKPEWAETATTSRYTRAMLDDLVRYIALRTRQLGWMIEFLQTGDDKPVRYVEAWAAADSQRSAITRDGASTTQP